MNKKREFSEKPITDNRQPMLAIIPTDTCYGLAGEFTEQDYLEIYRLKGRSFDKLLAILVEDYDDMHRYIEISDEQIGFLRNYPHPWSFLGKKNPDFALPDFLDEKKYQMLSIRVASVCIPQGSVIARIGDRQAITDNRYPMFLTSANLSGHPESTTLAEAQASFPGVTGYDG
jgi:tRNA A37 threonylcarbamoyladenosine synthetase subunit TsaC/SUA5/YrdC